jgi:predicted DNA-binding transcriptional regulator AlpA
MPTWNATYDYTGHLIDDHAANIAEQAAFVHTHTAAGTFTIGLRFDAPDHAKALRTAATAINAVTTLPIIAAAGTIAGPHRVTVGRVDAPTSRPRVISTSGAAAILGVSDARIRQIKDQLGFPKPLDIPGLRGEVYLTADIEAYREQRAAPAVDPGRPRADDEAKVDTALVCMNQCPGLPLEQRLLIERALQSHGSKFVREKARFVRQVMARHGEEVYRVHASSVGFGEAMRRVLELAGD